MLGQFKLGLKKSFNDHRDLKLQVEPNKTLPIKYEIPIIRCIYNQQHNDCSANAICNQIMSLKDLNDNTYPSRLFQYWISREIAGNTEADDGCCYRDAYKGLMTFGFVDDEIVPYSGDIYKKPSQEAYDKASKTLVKKYKSIMQNQYSIKYALSHNLPVAFGTMIYSNFKPDENNVIPMPEGEMVGGHAMLIIAYSDETKLFKVLNSWGSGWGDNGCCFMHYDHILNPNYTWEFWVITKE